ncbi:hypothetical protein PW52_01950 [Tamlana sedimentorum]|uniref:Sulfatase N-terminal domain-containing protein n=2 Tax=Neotamlana sedimentorum TaxID=1435349 RepID=A0A0D7WE06_9FLAO|nr:hypothetical protein PW52_01950 [Tamlana sedimentorum]
MLLYGNTSTTQKTFADTTNTKEKPPNIILIMADDLGFGDVGFNENKEVLTPQMDYMAKKGITFTNFYAAAPLCSPTRASVLTGRDPFRQGIFAAHTEGMRPAEKTIPELLKVEGYSTGFFGKWHLGWLEPDKVESRGKYSPPWHHGYDETFATKSAVPTWDPTKTPKGWTSWGSQEDGSWGGSIYIRNGEPVTDNLEGDDSRIIMDRAIPFIENSINKQQSFFATIWFHTPHEPVVAGPEYLAKYPNLPLGKQHYYGSITAMDDQIGRLKDFLKAQDVLENTIIFFCSDNGPADPQVRKGNASAKPFKGHKHQMWEGGLRVPSFVYWPGKITDGKISHYQSSTNDYLPTILDILGVTLNKKHVLDGVSLKPIIFSDQNLERLIPIASGYKRLYNGTELYAFVKGRYKICIPEKGDKMMLFDLKNDPGETNNLAAEKTELLNSMIAELEELKISWKQSREGKDYKW